MITMATSKAAQAAGVLPLVPADGVYQWFSPGTTQAQAAAAFAARFGCQPAWVGAVRPYGHVAAGPAPLPEPEALQAPEAQAGQGKTRAAGGADLAPAPEPAAQDEPAAGLLLEPEIDNNPNEPIGQLRLL